MSREDVLSAAGLERQGPIYLSRCYRNTLENNGLYRIEDFLAAAELGQAVTRADELRLVRRIERNVDDEPFVAYLKWYAPMAWHRRVFRRLRGRGTNGALVELERIVRLRRTGIDVPELLAFGQGVALERFRSFLLLSSMEHWSTLEEIAHSQRFQERLARPDVRHRLIAAVADLARRLHQAGIANPSLYSRHVIVESIDADPIRVGMLDLEDLQLDVRIDDRVRAADLGSLALTLQGEFVSLSDRGRFVRHYLQTDRLTPEARRLIRLVSRFYNNNRARQRFRHYAR